MQMRVAPLAGARIEMMARMESAVAFMVAPLAGARIEIRNPVCAVYEKRSLPSRERGLKYLNEEICKCLRSRSPRGSAD